MMDASPRSPIENAPASSRRPALTFDTAHTWHFAAIVLAFAAVLAFLSSMTWHSGATMSVQGGLWTVLLALALLAWSFVLAHGRSRSTPPDTQPLAIVPATPAPSPDEPNPHAQAELERAAEAAEAANIAKTRYLVNVCHEIRSPLNAISGYAQLLERDGSVPPAEAAGAIRRSVEHLGSLVEGLLEISRVESGVLKLRSDVIHLPDLLHHVFGMFRMQAEAKGLELRQEVTGRLPPYVRTDEKRFRQLLINLLSNAIKYTDRGSVTLAIAYRSQVAVIDVCDTGIGIRPEDIETIFEPFERGSQDAARQKPGIGLGLAITRALSQILGGEITATSTPGEGSRFRLRIFLPEPLEPPVSEVSHATVKGYAGPRRTVLLIDDDEAQTGVLAKLFARIGFAVHVANDGEAGIALARQLHPDLVLLDVQMPGMLGWDVAEQLRAIVGQALRIIMVSATRDTHGDTAGRRAHDAFIAKPVEQNGLLAEIGRQLGISWEIGDQEAGLTSSGKPPKLPKDAQRWAEQIRNLARVGHIRAVETALTDLENNVPASAPFVAAMRAHVRNFDLRSLIKMLDDQSRT